MIRGRNNCYCQLCEKWFFKFLKLEIENLRKENEMLRKKDDES